LIPSEAIESCRELLVALVEFGAGAPSLRRHAVYVYRAYAHALQSGEDYARRTLRWTRFIRALDHHVRFAPDESAAARTLRRIVCENADLLAPEFALT
jgi:hypothetical protein